MSVILSEDVRALKRMVFYNVVSVMENIQDYKFRFICIFKLKNENNSYCCARYSFILYIDYRNSFFIFYVVGDFEI